MNDKPQPPDGPPVDMAEIHLGDRYSSEDMYRDMGIMPGSHRVRPWHYDMPGSHRVRPWHYDKHGEPIEFDRWGELFEARDYQRVASTEIDDARVSTVWLGIDHSFGGGPPIIFETMVFGGPHDQAQMRYSTEAEAIDGHARTVDDIRTGRPLWFEAHHEATP
jgi:hypothetical protein